MSEQSKPNSELLVRWFENHYSCTKCGTLWDDEWSCMCNDRCPECNYEVEPATSVNLSRALTIEDFEGAMKLVRKRQPNRILKVSEEEAREYAEAILEGGEYRFREHELIVFCR